jgi:cytochrome c oxidase subunit 2
VIPLADGSLEPESPAASTITDLWWIMFWLGIAVFVVFAVALGVGLLRRRSESSETDEERSVSGRWFAVGGVVIPAIIVIIVLVATIVAMRATPDTAASNELEVEIVAHQWWWEVRYPGEGFTTANEVHIPVGRPVTVRLSSVDVIHSFWVPRLGGKIDMLPDRPNTMVLEADEPGEHKSQCAEFCGLAHANMALTVVAESEDDFASWLAQRRQPSADPEEAVASRGFDEFMASDCADCHTIRGTEADSSDGPDLTHFASRPNLGAMFVPNTRDNLAEWITDPHELKPGAKMPATDLEDEELDALLDYLEVLE